MYTPDFKIWGTYFDTVGNYVSQIDGYCTEGMMALMADYTSIGIINLATNNLEFAFTPYGVPTYLGAGVFADPGRGLWMADTVPLPLPYVNLSPVTASSAATVALIMNQIRLIHNGNAATVSYTLPPMPYDGQEVLITIKNVCAVTIIVATTPANQSIVGWTSPTSTTAGKTLLFVYSFADTSTAGGVWFYVP